MPTPVDLVRQCLTEAAARVLDDAIAVARRRNHAQTTSLHVVTALLALPSSILRDACARARSIPSNSPLQFRLLELCVGVSLDRLQISKSVDRPPISNSLTAAIKRGQASQRRNPENYHLQQIHFNQQTPSLLKLELKYFVLSILDDPTINRVFGEAGFQSFEIKRAMLQPPAAQLSAKFPRTPRCPPIFLCNLTDSGLGLDPGRAGPCSPLGFEDVDESCRRIGEVLIKRNEKNGRNPLLVGVYASKALRGFIENVTSRKLGVLPDEVYGVDVVCIERELNKFVLENGSEEMMALRFRELESAVEQCSGPGVVVNFGELKALIGDNVSSEAVKFVVSKLTSLLEMNSGKLWLIGVAANSEAYLKFSNMFPSIEKDWDLQLLPVHFKSRLIGSFVPFGGFFSSPLDPRSPMKSENQHSSCYLCTEKFEHEVAAILKEQSITSVAEQCPGKLPSWLERAELDTRKGVDMAKAKEDGTALHAEVLELQKKWSDICQRRHHTQIPPKLYTPKTRFQFPIPDGFQFTADVKEGSSKDPASNEHLCANLDPSIHLDLQKFLTVIPDTSIASTSQAENVNSQSRVQLNFSKDQHVENEGHPLLPHPPPNLTNLPHEAPSSSPIAVTTDLGLGTIYASTRQAEETPESKDQSLSHSKSLKFDTVPEGAKSYSCSGSSYDETLRKILSEKVGRQDEAIITISQAVSRCRNGHGCHRGSSGRGDIWLTFLGPDRVGKKIIASTLAEIIFGDQKNIICMDFSSQDRVSHPEYVFQCQELDGCDMEFRGHHVVDYIAEQLRKKPDSVVFLENVDKADPLAQIALSEATKIGKFHDSFRRGVNISKVIFVTTSKITKGTDSEFSEEKVGKFSEEILFGAKRWQMQMSVSCHSKDASRLNELQVNVTPGKKISKADCQNKRKLIDIDGSSAELQKRGHKSMRSNLDLNLPIEEAEEELSSIGYDSDATSESTEAWLEDFFDQVDAKVFFKPLNFDLLAAKLSRDIHIRFQKAMGSKVVLEIDDEVMIEILAAAWLSNKKRGIEFWIDSVLSRNFVRFQLKYHPKPGSVVKLAVCEGRPFEQESPEICLPMEINM
ncbi:protein SMAX1-LIKE 7-like isoform X2 [Mangifera indica]|uniref:protein SMAX1-LIKE 7-like isoform X2 n=1 Tax=Mangifera indica TaxID=29780 RepID=UPI001CF9FF80|nr:protein SMAX1-LIKE 7-like isoform X2 [Mangifera indica]